MLLQGPPVILSPADQLDEVAATKCQLEGGQLIEDAAQGPDISFVVVGNTTQYLMIMITVCSVNQCYKAKYLNGILVHIYKYKFAFS